MPPRVNFDELCRSISNLSVQASVGAQSLNRGAFSRADCYPRSTNGVVYGSLPRMTTQALPPNKSVSDYSNRTLLMEDSASSVCNIVRKWNVRFDGYRDPISFLERLDELMGAYNVPGTDLLKALPELLTGTALLW